MRLEKFPEARKIRELQFDGDFLDAGLGMTQHVLDLPDSRLVYPLDRSPATELFHYSRQVFGRDTQFGSIEHDLTLFTPMQKQQVFKPGIQSFATRLIRMTPVLCMVKTHQ